MREHKFIEGPKDKFGAKKIVNLHNVSNVAFEEGYDRFKNKKYKIIFNFNYSVSLKNSSKRIPDYVYFVMDSEEEYTKYKETLSEFINKERWFAPIINNNINRIVNPESISFISTDEDKNRIITNLNCSVSFYNDYDTLTSDFIFFDFESRDQMKRELVYLKDLLNV